MLMQPLAPNARQSTSSSVKYIPPPVRGWNARDDLSDMHDDEAITLDNLIPQDSGVKTRFGHLQWVTGINAAVTSLMEYSDPTGKLELFAATASDIYDVTVQGAVGSAVVSTLSNGEFQHTLFATSGGTFLIAVNGADGVISYDGSAWDTETITDVTAANLITVTQHISRLWFIEEDTMKVWYLPVLSIAGAATAIDFGGLSRLGGKLMAMASWTRDSGTGIEDLAVFITSRGEVHVYAGTDPSAAETWQRVGTFKIAEPVGRRCVIKVGGDIGIITSQGVVPLSGVLSRAESAQGKVAITDKIRNAFTEAFKRLPSSRRWQCLEFPVEKLLILNVPILEGSRIDQYVMNANTGAWCRFTGINATVWSLLGTDMFFAGLDGTIHKAVGTTDDGATITGLSISAFNDFGSPLTKAFRRIRPQFFGPSGYRPSIGIALDYGLSYTLYSSPAFSQSGTAWDEGDWDTASWASPEKPNVFWQAIKGEGFTAALVVQVSSTERITYNGAKILFERGDQL